MHILITGAAGMIGRKLTARLVADGALNGRPIDRLTLLDVGAPPRPGQFRRAASTPSPPTSPTRGGAVRRSPAGPT